MMICVAFKRRGDGGQETGTGGGNKRMEKNKKHGMNIQHQDDQGREDQEAAWFRIFSKQVHGS